MKTKKIYMFKIEPKGWNSSLQFSCNFIPNKDELKNIVIDVKDKSFYPESFIKQVLTNIDMYGIPAIGEDNQGCTQWKMKGESIYNSKGYIAVKVVDIYFK